MRKSIQVSLIAILIFMMILSCSKDKKTNPDTEPPTVAITYPPNNSSFTSGTAINIVAEADDNEEVDNVKFYIDGVNLYEDTSEPYSYNWNTTDLSGTHTLYAKATDGSENTSTSDIITVTITDSGEAPNPPSNPNPQSGAVNISTSTTLSWTCTDPNGDSLTYDVYFGTNVNPSLVSSDLTINNYNPGTLDETTTYYWYIIGTDTDENSTTGPLWSFTTLTSGGGNQAPNPPSNPNPEDNATDVSIETNLSWTCTDPEGDPLTYDVYFGTSTNPSAVSSGQSITTYDPGTLDEETTYYWKIVANDDHSNSTTGEIWEFETENTLTGTLTDIDGNVYQTIMIGDQEWMAEDLKVTHYRNGDPIPNVTDNSQWMGLLSGAFCYYENDPVNGEIYGALYNWSAVDDNRYLAPEGWHVPTEDDWQELIDFLGGESIAGGKMKALGTIQGGDGLWNEPNTGATNESGFNGLPGGYRHYYNGGFTNMSIIGWYWSSTDDYYNAYSYHLNCYDTEVTHELTYQLFGFSVRLVRDQ